jgi:putative PIN family toxin of toxin-antitoxin system
MGLEDRYVFDTGVLVSAALFPNSIPGQAMRESLKRGRLMLSQATTEELVEVLSRPKFDRYIRRPTRRRFLAALLRSAEVAEPNRSFKVCRDAKDDKFLELAVCGKASYLVTGDKALLDLNPFQGIPIVTPAELLAAFASARRSG